MLPQFVVIGAQKAGSTFLLECLEEHPDIFMPPYEVAFFDGDLYDAEQLDKFEKHFEDAQPGQLIGVKRPNLLGLPECPERLFRHLPEAKLIAILRSPVERAISAYFHYMKTGFLPIAPAEVGLPNILAGEYDKYPRAQEILKFGLYAEHLSAYDEYYGPSQLQVILLDDVKHNSQQVLSKLYEFLGVKEDFRPSSQRRRPMAASYSLSRLRLWDAVDRRLRRPLHDGAFFERYGNWFAKTVYRANVLVDRQIWSRLFPAGPPKVSAELRKSLNEYYRPDIDQLRSRLSRPLSGWGDNDDCEKPAERQPSEESSPS